LVLLLTTFSAAAYFTMRMRVGGAMYSGSYRIAMIGYAGGILNGVQATGQTSAMNRLCRHYGYRRNGY
jgi:hypothetical protein